MCITLPLGAVTFRGTKFRNTPLLVYRLHRTSCCSWFHSVWNRGSCPTALVSGLAICGARFGEDDHLLRNVLIWTYSETPLRAPPPPSQGPIRLRSLVWSFTVCGATLDRFKLSHEGSPGKRITIILYEVNFGYVLSSVEFFYRCKTAARAFGVPCRLVEPRTIAAPW